MKVSALCIFGLSLLQIFHAKKNKKNHIDIQTLDLTPADVSADGDPLQCDGGANISPGSSIVIQTPKYPRRYPNGKRGRGSWAFYFTAGTKIELTCEKFKVKKGDRFCITLWSGKKCFFGKRSESFKFPYSDELSSFPDSYVKIKMDFRANKRKNSKGFRFV